MKARHDRTPFGLAIVALLIGGPFMFLPIIRQGGIPNWAEPLFFVGIPTLFAVLFLFLGKRQRSLRLPLAGLLLVPLATLELTLHVLRSAPSDYVRSIPLFTIAVSFLAMMVLYTFRMRKRQDKPKIAWVKWTLAILAGATSGCFLILMNLAFTLKIPFIQRLLENLSSNRNLVPGIAAVLVLGSMLLFLLFHLIDLWKFGPTEEDRPDFEAMIDRIAAENDDPESAQTGA